MYACFKGAQNNEPDPRETGRPFHVVVSLDGDGSFGIIGPWLFGDKVEAEKEALKMASSSPGRRFGIGTVAEFAKTTNAELTTLDVPKPL